MKQDSFAPISSIHKAEFIAACMRTATGIICLGAAVFYVPTHQVVPILMLVSISMVVHGSYNAWRTGAQERRLKPYARMCIYVGIIGTMIMTMWWVVENIKSLA